MWACQIAYHVHVHETHWETITPLCRIPKCLGWAELTTNILQIFQKEELLGRQ